MLAFHGLQTDAYSEVQKILSRLTAGLYHRAADVGEDRTEGVLTSGRSLQPGHPLHNSVS